MSGESDQIVDQFILTLDVGTTSIKCFLFDQNTNIRGHGSTQIELEYPKPGWVEICPVKLLAQVQHVIHEAIGKGGVNPSTIKCITITTQRCSFVTWDENDVPLHKIITWKDKRAESIVKSWNKSYTLKAFRLGCSILYGITQNKRYLSGSVFKLMNEQVCPRLMWVLDNIPGIREKIAANQVKFGTLDTYLVYKLTNGEKFLTDYSNASPLGFFDPYTLSYADWALNMFKIPSNILPKVMSTCDDFGNCSLFPGIKIPIVTVISDQSSSMFGSGSYSRGNLKVTLGTGTFLDVNTGTKPHASISGIYPLVGWKYGKEICYIAEGCSHDTGNAIEWAHEIGLYETIEDSSRMATSVLNSNGVYFIPAFHGIQSPYNDIHCSAGFIGITSTTKRSHLARAVLESIAFRVQQLLTVLQSETDFTFECIRVDGGVANNDFILQTIADLTKKRVERPETNLEMTALGCCFLGGIHTGIWKNKEELTKLYKIEKVFLPILEHEEQIFKNFVEWEGAVERFLQWTNNTNK